MGMGGNENLTFSHFQTEEEKQPATSASPETSADSNTLDCQRVFDFNDLCDPEDDHQQGRNERAVYVNMYGNGSGREWE